MMKKVKQMLKNQKGLTLVELLAVVVILGIIAAIAVPSIGGIIDNTKRDAHIANAEQMVSAARMAVTSGEIVIPAAEGKTSIKLSELENNGYLEEVDSPGTPYDKDSSIVTITKSIDTTTKATKLAYEVTLKTGTGNASKILTGDPGALDRDEVTLK